MSTTIPVGKGTFKVFGDFDKLTDGWQPNTDYQDSRGGFRLDMPIAGGGSFFVNYQMFLNQQQFGSPLPVDPPTGEVIPGFKPDNNYEFLGARVDHRVYALTVGATIPINRSTSLQNTLGLTKDDATIAQSFVGEIDAADPNIANSNGYNIKPKENDLYDDLHLVTSFQAGGKSPTDRRRRHHDRPDQVERLDVRLRFPDRSRHRAEPDRHPGDGLLDHQGRSHVRRPLRQRPVDAGPVPHDLGRRALRHHVRDAERLLHRRGRLTGHEARRPVVGRRFDPRPGPDEPGRLHQRPERLLRGQDQLQARGPGPARALGRDPLARAHDQRGSRHQVQPVVQPGLLQRLVLPHDLQQPRRFHRGPERAAPARQRRPGAVRRL